MKKLFVLLSVVMITVAGYAQKLKESDVPDNVKAKQNATFPDAKSVKWSKENAAYEAEFKLNKIEISCLIDGNAELLETETEIAASELPEPVKTAIEKIYAGCKINEASKIVKQDMVSYEAEVKIEKDKYDLLFTPEGILIGKTKIEPEVKSEENRGEPDRE
jgi:hypothetical protein